MNEDLNECFVPYEQALALKNLGFDKPCFGYYNSYKIISSHSESPLDMCDYNSSEEEDDAPNPISAPTYSQAFKWFEKKYNLHNSDKEAESACLKKLIEIVEKINNNKH